LKTKDQFYVTCYFYFTSYALNMFRTLIYPSSGAYDYSVELPHWSYCSWFDVCWSFCVVGLEWYPCCRLQPSLLMCSTCFGHEYIHHQELATLLLNYHIGRIFLGSMCVGVSVWLGWSIIRIAGFSLHFLCVQHVSDVNKSIIRSLRLFCWITTLVVCGNSTE